MVTKTLQRAAALDPLYALPADQHLLTEKEAAEFLKVSARTMQRWRLSGEGPRYRRCGPRTARYTRAELLSWSEGRTFQSTSAEIAPGRKPKRAAERRQGTA